MIRYPIIEKNQKDDNTVVKAGIKKVDEQKRIIFEGFHINVDKSLVLSKEIIFAVTGIEENKELDFYDLLLHTHQGECCDADTHVKISIELLKKWTGLSRRDIETGFRKIHLGATYNLLATLPRTITITNNEIIIQKGRGKKVDPFNVCKNILSDSHPLDK